MEKEKKDKIIGLLNQMKESIIKDAQKANTGIISSSDEDKADPNDRGSLESDRNFTLRLLDRDRKLMKKIESAIARVEADDYGECIVCGDPIGYERLLARPVTDLCIDCKEEEEKRETY